MSEVVRPSLVRSLPVLGFAVAAAVALAAGSPPRIVGVACVLLVVGGMVYLALVVSTSVVFGSEGVRVSSLGRTNEFRRSETTIRLHKIPAGFLRSGDALEFKDPNGRMTISLALFGPRSREEILRLAQSGSRSSASSGSGDTGSAGLGE